MVYRIHKTDEYTVISNYHLTDTRLSWKAKGVLSLLLSLPEEWDYSVKSIMDFCSDGRDCTASALTELEKFGYLKRERVVVDGKLGGCNYDVYEVPPITGFPITENPLQEERKSALKERRDFNYYLSSNNTSSLNSNKLTTKSLVCEREEEEKNIQEKKKREIFVKPTVEDVAEYCKERGNTVDANTFWDFYESKGWKVGRSGMADWKACVRTWERKRDGQKPREEKKHSWSFDQKVEMRDLMMTEDEYLYYIENRCYPYGFGLDDDAWFNFKKGENKNG